MKRGVVGNQNFTQVLKHSRQIRLFALREAAHVRGHGGDVRRQHGVDHQLPQLAGGSEIRLAQEEEMRRLFPECEPGAMQPFGPLYGQSVFADVALASEAKIVFNAGTHTEAIAMRWPDFAKSVRPIVGRFAEPPPGRVGEFRCSTANKTEIDDALP